MNLRFQNLIECSGKISVGDCYKELHIDHMLKISSHKNKTPTTKFHRLSTPGIPSFEYRKQHSVPLTTEDAQHRDKCPSVKFNQPS